MALFSHPAPSAATTMRARRIAGIANIMSVTLMITAEVQRPRKPATTPAIVPITPAIATARQAISRDTPRPSSTNDRMSRPNWSVPKGWLQVGCWRRAAAF
jgi:hypothetical protein